MLTIFAGVLLLIDSVIYLAIDDHRNLTITLALGSIFSIGGALMLVMSLRRGIEDSA